MRHLRTNFRRNVKDPDSELNFYKAGCAKDKDTYKALRAQISDAGNRYIERSLGGNLHRWAQYKDGGRRYGMMTTNCSDFNGVLKGARALPIQALVARTLYKLVKYFYKRRTIRFKG